MAGHGQVEGRPFGAARIFARQRRAALVQAQRDRLLGRERHRLAILRRRRRTGCDRGGDKKSQSHVHSPLPADQTPNRAPFQGDRRLAGPALRSNCIAIHRSESMNARSMPPAMGAAGGGRMKPLGALTLAAFALAAAADPPRELVVSGDGIVATTVNGVPGRLRIDPAVPALPMLGSAWAERARLRPGPFAFSYLVGSERVNGRSAVARIAIGDGAAPRRHRVGWTERPYTAAADGVAGPGGLPQQIVRFVLGPPRAGERTVALPM